MSSERVTYATLSAGQTPDFKKSYDQALDRVRAWFGREHAHVIEGQRVTGDSFFEDRSPVDTRVVIGRFPQGRPADVDRAVAAARRAFPAWSGRPFEERASVLRRAADLIEEHGFDLSALLSLEVGKSRLEAMGDVTETADLIRYYCEQMERNHGFDRPMERFSEREETRSVLRPYGVWAVISPFNFPAALAGGPLGGALVAGNTVVLKPSPEASLIGLALHDLFREAGLPDGVLNVVFGGGEDVGEPLALHPGGGRLALHGIEDGGDVAPPRFSREWPKPCITEMGGKNPALVMPSADLDAAAEGVLRSAFGLQGQKCSACSRVYVHEAVRGAVHRSPSGEDGPGDDRRPEPRRRLPGARDPRARLSELRALRGPRPARRQGARRRRAAARGRPRPRLLRGPERRQRPAPGPPALSRRAVRAHRLLWPASARWRKDSGSPTTPSTA